MTRLALITALAFAVANFSGAAHAQPVAGMPLDALEALSAVNELAPNFWACNANGRARYIVDDSVRVTGANVRFRCMLPAGAQDYDYSYATHETARFYDERNYGLAFCIQPGEREMCRDQIWVSGEVRRQEGKQREFTDAWRLLASPRSPPVPAEDVSFQSALANAGAADGESLRRVQVQVEAALRANRNLDAARLYRDTLRTSPAWAEGHFNLGLLYGDLELFPEAITEMRRYLYLTPNASDARAVQDRVYEWEAALAAP